MTFFAPVGDGILSGLYRDRERQIFNGSKTAEGLRQRGLDAEAMWKADYVVPAAEELISKDDAARVEDEEVGQRYEKRGEWNLVNGAPDKADPNDPASLFYIWSKIVHDYETGAGHSA